MIVRSGKAPRFGAFFVLAALLALAAPAGRGDSARIARALDGDSLRLSDGRQLRLIGINAPELGTDPAAAEPFARAAQARLEELTLGRTLRLDFDLERADRYGRLLAYVVLPDGTDVQERLLAEGLARAIAVPPNIGRLKRYLAREQEARGAGRGLWTAEGSGFRSAESLAPGDTGFRLVRDTVTAVGASRRLHYFDLGPRLSVQVPREDWERYFRHPPADYRGRTIEARGWITEHDGRLRLRVQHPAMMVPVP